MIEFYKHEHGPFLSEPNLYIFIWYVALTNAIGHDTFANYIY